MYKFEHVQGGHCIVQHAKLNKFEHVEEAGTLYRGQGPVHRGGARARALYTGKGWGQAPGHRGKGWG